MQDAEATAPAKRERAKAKRKHFNVENITKLPMKKRQYWVWDAGKNAARGLGILVNPSGAKSFWSTYYFPGSPTPYRRKLGRVGEMALAKARELCKNDRNSARAGLDPQANDPGKSDTFAAAVAEYIEREQRGRRRNASADEAKRLLLKNYRDKYRRPVTATGEHDTAGHESDWHRRPIGTIRPQEIMKLLEFVRDGDGDKKHRPRPYLANALFGHLKVFFAWCAKPGIDKLVTNPMVGIDKPWDGAKRRERDWFGGAAADKAIKALWRAADELGGTEGQYLKLLLLVGKRKGALARMLWEEIDETWFWTPPKSDKKNKRLHGIPLPGLAQRILHPRKAHGAVFADDNGGYINVRGSKLQNKIIRASGITTFLFHGCRHLAETKLAELEIAPHIRDLLFDHVPGRGSGAGYDHHAYKNEMRAALETWASYIERIVTSDEAVTRLR